MFLLAPDGSTQADAPVYPLRHHAAWPARQPAVALGRARPNRIGHCDSKMVERIYGRIGMAAKLRAVEPLHALPLRSVLFAEDEQAEGTGSKHGSNTLLPARSMRRPEK